MKFQDDKQSLFKDTFLAKRSENREIRQLAELKPSVSADQIVETVCDEFDCKTDMIVQKGRRKNVARDVAIYLSRNSTAIAALI